MEIFLSLFSTIHRFKSFAPPHNHCRAKWYVDGQDYMSAVADAIEAASDEIFIADWQMNPHIFMKRPDTGVDSLYWRLDKMLLRKADQGVKIYILLYWESTDVAEMDLGSKFTLATLSHNHIEIRRHPDGLLPCRWSHHEKIVLVDCSIAFVGGIDLCFGRWDTHKHELIDDFPVHACIKQEHESTVRRLIKGMFNAILGDTTNTTYSRWVGKDYGNTFQVGHRTRFDQPMKDYVDRKVIPRMPWHDVSCSFTGAPVQDLYKHFIQRYSNHQVDNYRPTPGFVGERSWLSRLWNFFKHMRSVTTHTIPDPSSNNARIQLLRSVTTWSADEKHETSILNAYLYLIKESKHFIYIENQFFISATRKVKNQIMPALADRIIRAYRNKEVFHVMVVIPLKPEFSGEWHDGSGKDLRTITYWNNFTISEGNDSLYKRLENAKVPKNLIPKYFKVYGLRTHGTINNHLVTEVIYVHSKMMVVDDVVSIIGSANINDRSMLGNRDSEVAVIIEDTEMLDSEMNGWPFKAGQFSHSLRCHLIREHLGLLNDEDYKASAFAVEDPLNSNFLNLISVTAENNSSIYETVFGGEITPNNHVWNFKGLKQYQSKHGLAKCNPDAAKKALDALQGSLVSYPSLFLKDVLEPRTLDTLDIYS